MPADPDFSKWTANAPAAKPSRRPAHRPKKTSAAPAVVGAILAAVAVIAGIAATTALDFKRAKKSVNTHIIKEALEQYQIVAKTTKDPMELSLRAGVVAEAFLMAKDSKNYRQWKKIADDFRKAAETKSAADIQRAIREASP